MELLYPFFNKWQFIEWLLLGGFVGEGKNSSFLSGLENTSAWLRQELSALQNIGAGFIDGIFSAFSCEDFDALFYFIEFYRCSQKYFGGHGFILRIYFEPQPNPNICPNNYLYK